MPRSTTVALVLAGALLAGCSSSGETDPVEVVTPASDRAGVQATGQLDGRRVAISRGSPIVRLEDCDVADGDDLDLCVLVRTIDGLDVELVVENPDALVEGASLPVRDEACAASCDALTDALVVDVRVADELRRAIGGRVEVARADDRVVAEFDLQLPFGDRLDGDLDIAVPGR